MVLACCCWWSVIFVSCMLILLLCLLTVAMEFVILSCCCYGCCCASSTERSIEGPAGATCCNSDHPVCDHCWANEALSERCPHQGLRRILQVRTVYERSCFGVESVCGAMFYHDNHYFWNLVLCTVFFALGKRSCHVADYSGNVLYDFVMLFNLV